MKKPKFTDSQFLSATEKQRVLAAWVTFLRYGCKETHFSKPLYRHLTLHGSFVAHYGVHGFYSHYFEEPLNALQFLAQFDPDTPGVSVEYGDTRWRNGDYADVNEAMCDAARPFLPALRKQFQDIHGARCEAQAHSALAAVGIKLDPVKARKALEALVSTVEATGGIEYGVDGLAYPVADDEWPNLAEAYLVACEALEHEPLVHKED